MLEQNSDWQIQQPVHPPEWFLEEVRRHAPGLSGHYAAPLLWQRGIQDKEELERFLTPKTYQPASPFEFGQEMQSAVQRLQHAYQTREKVAIWGDFDADGITATSVLWDGLGQFFPRDTQLSYYIPNRLTESHGLNRQGIDALANRGTRLIVTCDTGSTNLEEIDYATDRGIDIVVTDHHTLPVERPSVVAIVNPRYLPHTHPLAHLSGVAVAYKLVEALYLTMPEVLQDPKSIEELWDLVAIGLIADLVELSGDCRYLAQVGIERLQREFQKPPTQRRRPGVGELLELCNRNGDRPTDISFGIGPRINAVSRIHGDSSFCVELLTTRDRDRAKQLAIETELANTRRQSLQKDVAKQVIQKLEQLDLSTTGVIVLQDTQWPGGVLGLVAGQVAQEYGRPTILLSTDSGKVGQPQTVSSTLNSPQLARGSARSVNQIDLYELVKEQAHLLHRFGGHPFAAGLSLPIENIPVFTEAINRHFRELFSARGGLSVQGVQADLVCNVAELGQPLFRELKLLEPCGMGNPVPQILIKNCTFEKVWHRNIKDSKGRKVQYIKTEFEIRDASTEKGFPGIWWGHYKDEIPPHCCDAVVELDYNTYKKRYEVRLIAVRPAASGAVEMSGDLPLEIIDYRSEATKTQVENIDEKHSDRSLSLSSFLLLEECPRSWDEFYEWFELALQGEKKLAIAYPPPKKVSPVQIWQELVGIAKYLSRTGQWATRQKLLQKLQIGDRTLDLGLETLTKLGFKIASIDGNLQGFSLIPTLNSGAPDLYSSGVLDEFFAAVREEQFRRQYFYNVPVSTLQAIAYAGFRIQESSMNNED